MNENTGKTTRLEDEELDPVAAGAGRDRYYCVEGYSKVYGGSVKLYVSTYMDAVKLCEKLSMDTGCIKEISEGC